jgi:ABC-type bacteriocin/lantibiotic exporter with double-glycine peptidase domain
LTTRSDAFYSFIKKGSLLNRLANVTVIIVAHRYSTIREVDRILQPYAGELVCFDSLEAVRGTVPKFALRASLQGFDS